MGCAIGGLNHVVCILLKQAHSQFLVYGIIADDANGRGLEEEDGVTRKGDRESCNKNSVCACSYLLTRANGVLMKWLACARETFLPLPSSPPIKPRSKKHTSLPCTHRETRPDSSRIRRRNFSELGREREREQVQQHHRHLESVVGLLCL